MRSRSVKALSQRGDLPQRLIEILRRKFHKIGHFRPYQGSANWPVGVQFHEDGAVQGKLANVVCRDLFDSPWGVAVCVEICDRNWILSDREAVNLARHQHGSSIGGSNLTSNRDFSAATGREQRGEIRALDQK